MPRSLLVSLAVHALVVMLVLALGRDRRPEAHDRADTVTVIDLVPAARSATPHPTPTPGLAPGGGTPAGSPTRARTRVRARAATATAADPRGEVRIEAWQGDAGDGRDGRGDGAGAGLGGGLGGGLGLGEGGTIARYDDVPAAPPPPRASKARPPRLIYPARQREIDDAELFVARVTVDVEGFVAGARIVRGFGGRRDEVAASAIWRFRYAPALDDDGVPIRATVDQRFLVD